MAYIWRGRGPRTRGGYQGNKISDSVGTRYERTDSNMFSCLRGSSQDGDESQGSDTEDTFSDKSNKSDSESPFQVVRHQKKRKLNSSSGGGSKLLHASKAEAEAEVDVSVDYETLSNEEKLNLILSKVSVNENRFKRLESIFDTVANHQRRISKIESVVKSYDDRIRLLEYKSIDLEARSRRNNILFYGLKENRNEDCKDIICQFVSDQLQISISDTDISRAHRIGRFDPRKVRPVIVAFQAYPTAEKIIKQGYLLKDSNFSISRDFPMEILRARKTLWPEYKQIKLQNPSAKVVLIYPAKLLVNQRVVKDLFPEWDSLINGSRIDITHPSQQSFGRSTRTFHPDTLQSTPAPNVSNETEIECMDVATSGDAVASGDGVQPERGSQELDTTVKSHAHPVVEVQLEADVHALESGNSDNKNADDSGNTFKTPVSTQRAARPTIRTASHTRSMSRSRVRGQSESRFKGPDRQSETQSLPRTDSKK